MNYLTILGATGSIGTQTLDVVARHAEHFTVFALSGEQNADLLLAQCQQFTPRYAVIGEKHYPELKQRFADNNLSTELLCGQQALIDIAQADSVTHVVAAIVGGAGLRSVHAAVAAGKTVLLANKEALVMTGNLLLDTAKQTQSTILPIDSEHNALFQCMPKAQGFREKPLKDAGISKLLLTASGGPFRQIPLAALANQTPEAACKHPNWSMGRKISVDSATMMNKGLEYIEAKLLFNAADNELDVIIHPQSIIHSLVQYQDGTSLAQLGYSDMRVPIAYGLGYPLRLPSGVDDIDLTTFNLTFEPVDYARYPCLQLATHVANDNAKATVLNAANEIAVEYFLAKRIAFGEIANVVKTSLEKITTHPINHIDDVLALDAKTRRETTLYLNTRDAL